MDAMRHEANAATRGQVGQGHSTSGNAVLACNEPWQTPGQKHLRLRRQQRYPQARQRVSGQPLQQAPVRGPGTQQHQLPPGRHRHLGHRKLRQPHESRMTVVMAHNAEKL